jgi:hypothetical protein
MLERLNHEHTVIVIGRGHSGTRLISFALQEAGVYMGEPHNIAGDLLPPQPLYEASRLIGPEVKQIGEYEWDFSRLVDNEIPAAFQENLEIYLQSLLNSEAEYKGWKLPENTLIFPWLVRVFPKAKFIYWVRDPRDSILGLHGTDRLEKWRVPAKKFLLHSRKLRAASWKYQYDIVAQTPKPEHFLTIRFEDFILKQPEVREELGAFLGLSVPEISVNPDKVGGWRRGIPRPTYGFLKQAMKDLHYL